MSIMLNKKTLIMSLIFCLILMGLPCNLAAITGEEQFYKADALYKKFSEDPEKIKYRENWLDCITQFKIAYSKDPEGSLAPASLYLCGKLFHELYQRSAKASDKKSAIEYFDRVIKYFPKSYYSLVAEKGLKSLQPKTEQHHGNKESSSLKPLQVSGLNQPSNLKIKKRKNFFETSKAAYKASKQKASSHNTDTLKQTPLTILGKNTNHLISVTKLRVWSNPSYTRVVIDADGETSYTHKLLDKDPSAQKPQRLYIDFEKSKLGGNIDKIIPINDDLLNSARAGQYQPESVRVVIDIKSFKTYKIFSLRNPFRIVIDVWGKNAGNGLYAKSSSSKSSSLRETPVPRKTTSTSKPRMPLKIEPPHKKNKPERIYSELPKKEPLQRKNDVTPKDLARQFALGVKRIVIDPGHGGHDPGAVGYYKRVLEKNIVLSIGKRLARKIRQEIGCEVIMTRSTDRFLSLEERTAIANTRNADLFISLHTNSHKDRRAYGIETYFLNLATDEDAILVAARENATSRKNISDLQTILNDLMQHAKINESSRMAAYIQKSLCKYMRGKYGKIKNKGVKQAPFYVLLGAHMPSILVELSFISNKRECERLKNSSYQENLCDAMIKGIRSYIGETNPTALLRLRSGIRN